MNCPKCNTDISWTTIQAALELASDGSFITARIDCPSCKAELEAYYPFESITEEV